MLTLFTKQPPPSLMRNRVPTLQDSPHQQPASFGRGHALPPAVDANALGFPGPRELVSDDGARWQGGPRAPHNGAYFRQCTSANAADEALLNGNAPGRHQRDEDSAGGIENLLNLRDLAMSWMYLLKRSYKGHIFGGNRVSFTCLGILRKLTRFGSNVFVLIVLNCHMFPCRRYNPLRGVTHKSRLHCCHLQCDSFELLLFHRWQNDEVCRHLVRESSLRYNTTGGSKSGLWLVPHLCWIFFTKNFHHETSSASTNVSKFRRVPMGPKSPSWWFFKDQESWHGVFPRRG